MPKQNLQNNIEPEQHELSNGIPVILQHYDGPVAATYWWVKTGSVDEKPAEAGFAHFLEHMLFKDAAAKETGRASTGKMARTIESLGGDINAYTSFDQTVYHVTCAAHHWLKVIDAFGEMAKPQRFLKDNFLREREVILEEMRRSEDSPERQLFQKLFSLTFRSHPYGRPVIGFAKTLKAAKVGNLEAFYKRNYVSGRMGLILVGPIHDGKGERRKQILKLLEKRYGSKVLPKRASEPTQLATEKPLRNDIALDVRRFDVKNPTLSVAFRVPELSHEDIPALDLLAGILGMGELSRVYQRLFYGTSIASEASGGLFVPHDPGMLYFQAETDSLEKINPAAKQIFEELQRIRDEGPTQDELSRVIVNSESEKLYATQSADGMAGRLGFLKFTMGDLSFDDRYLERLRAVDGASIQEVARKYFDYRRMSAVTLTSKQGEEFDMTEIGRMAKEMLAPEITEVETKGKARVPAVDKGARPVEYLTLPSGIRVAVFERPQSHVFSLHAAALGGLRLELAHPIADASKDWGSSYMMSLTWAKGTPTRDARAIAALTEGHAAGIDAFAGRNTVGLQMTGLARDWSKLSDLFSEVLLQPDFAASELDQQRRVAEDAIRSIEDHSSQLCTKMFLETLFENHPYGKLTTGTLESIGAMDRDKLKAFHGAWIRPERMVVAISGAVSRGKLDPWLAELDKSAQRLCARGPSGSTAVQEELDLKAPRWIERHLKREQTHILVGGLGIRNKDEDRFALRLMQTILGGQSGRLFIELREKRSLAYSVAPIAFEGMERGYVGTYIACGPTKRKESIEGIQRVLETLAAKGPTEAEMARAREFYLGRRAMDMQGDPSLAAHYGLEEVYGYRRMTEEELIKKVRSVSRKQVQEACRKYLVEPHMVTAVVG